MDILSNPAKRLSLLLWLIAVHSFGVGLGLMIHPQSLLTMVGFNALSEPFFPTQGGIFHIIMAVGYAIGARDVAKNQLIINFAIFVKTVATIFLFGYFFVIQPIWVVLLSGLGDGAMAIVLYLANRTFVNSQ